MIRESAAVILHRGDASDFEVLLVERSPRLRFLGGFFAFPGGVLSRLDCDRLVECARRELFEETGVLLGDGASAVSASLREEARHELLEDEREGREESSAAWQQILGRVTTGSLQPVCRLLTPPFSPIQFDTQFFLAEIPDGVEPEIRTGELVSGAFWRPADALAKWRRGEMRLAPPVLLLLERLSEFGLRDFIQPMKQQADSFLAGGLPPVRFVPGIVMATLGTPTVPPATTINCYIVGSDRLYIIDPGTPYPAEQQRLFDLLESRCAGGAELAGVLLTHHHEDHIGSVALLCNKYGITVRAHEKTFAHLSSRVPVGEPLSDGDRVELGVAPDGTHDWALEVLFSPGHTWDHVCFRDTRYHAVLVGDMASTISTIVIDPPEGHMRTYLDSLRRLTEVEMGMLFPAHGPPAPKGRSVLRRFLEHREMREEKLVAALASGVSASEKLLEQVYDDVDRKVYPYARRSLAAALEKLCEDGRVSESNGLFSLI